MEKESAKSDGATLSKIKKKCPYCPFASYYSGSLTVHVRRHTGEKPFQCPYCTGVRRFGDRSNMNSHIRRYHKELARPRKSTGSFRRQAPSSRTMPSLLKPKSISSKINSTSHFDYYPLDQTPVINSVYSATELSESPDNGPFPIEITENMGSPTSVSTDLTPSPKSLPETSLHQTLLKGHRRKPPFVQKKVLSNTEENDESIFSSFQRMISQNMYQEHSEEDNFDMPSVHENNDSFTNNTSDIFIPNSSNHLSDDKTTEDKSSVVIPAQNNAVSASDSSPTTKDMYACKHCDIYFKNCVLHTLHMGCHGYDDPFKCNTCGVKCNNAIEFHCHFARGNHNGAL
uniref:zinc finger protein Pegasus-like n=1 Tax=Styela clava TaxID=7725 RepID=UPI0019394E6F|nr:zinc finger protein Pegasus-like [Styela clava]